MRPLLCLALALAGAMVPRTGLSEPGAASSSPAIARTGAAAPADPHSSLLSVEYDEEGRVSRISGPGRGYRQFRYAESGLPGRIVTNHGEILLDSSGRVSAVQDASGETRFGYAGAQLTEVTSPAHSRVLHQYDDFGEIAAIAWVDHQLRYERDLLGRLLAIETPAGKITFRYDRDHTGFTRTLPNGCTSRFAFDDEGRLIEIAHADATGRSILTVTYTYAAGLVDRIIERAGGRATEIRYRYDGYGQLLEADYSDGRHYRFAYDKHGNRTRAEGTGAGVEASFDAGDRLLALGGKTVRHDEAGNIIAVGGRRYGYDALGFLVADGPSTYDYNALGWRIRADGPGGSRNFVHGVHAGSPFVIAETGAMAKRYLWADGHYFGQIEENGRILFFLEDRSGAPRVAVDADGAVVDVAEFSPFGRPLARIEGVTLGFQGADQLGGGPVQFGRRAYHPALGRFLTPEIAPPRLLDGIVQNPYAFAGNSPTNFADGTGAYACGFGPQFPPQFAHAFPSPFAPNCRNTPHPAPQPWLGERSRPDNRPFVPLPIPLPELEVAGVDAAPPHWTNEGPVPLATFLARHRLGLLDPADREQVATRPSIGLRLAGDDHVVLVPLPKPNLNAVAFRNWLFALNELVLSPAVDLLTFVNPVTSTVKVARIAVPACSRALECWQVWNSDLPEEQKRLHTVLAMTPSRNRSSSVENFFDAKKNELTRRAMASDLSSPHSMLDTVLDWLSPSARIEHYSVLFATLLNPRLRSDPERSGEFEAFRIRVESFLRSGLRTNPMGGVQLLLLEDMVDSARGFLFPPKDRTTGTDGLEARVASLLPSERRDDATPVSTLSAAPLSASAYLTTARRSAATAPAAGASGDDPSRSGEPPPGGPPPGGAPPADARADVLAALSNTANVALAGDLPLPAPSQVGGVYLGATADVLARELLAIEGVAVDDETGRLLLVGPGTGPAALEGVRLDDLAVAFRTVFRSPEAPAVSIDPDPQNPRAPQQTVRFHGGIKDTHFGYVLFEADRVMKTLGHGEDNITREPVSAPIDGYYNELMLGLASPEDKEGPSWNRYWLVPRKVEVTLSADRRTLVFSDTEIIVRTQAEKIENGRFVAADEVSATAQYFANHLATHYDEYAEHFPIFAELEKMAELVALAQWIEESGVAPDLSWLDDIATHYPTPRTTPAIVSRASARTKEGNVETTRSLELYGGVDFDFDNAYVEGSAGVAALAERARAAVRGHDGPAAVRFEGPDGASLSAVGLPSGELRVFGAKRLASTELGLIDRVFNSFHNDPGAFGHSWRFDLPSLEFRVPSLERVEHVTLGETRVRRRVYYLRTAFGSPVQRFAEHGVDQEGGSIVVYPDVAGAWRGLYPDDEAERYRIEGADGRALVFDAAGRLVARDLTGSARLTYRYDDAGRLKTVAQLQGAEPVASVTFSYDDADRVVAASNAAVTLRYTYDERGDLVAVEAPGGVVTYAYDGRHLVTGVAVDGAPVAGFAYDHLGRVQDQDGAQRPGVADGGGRVVDVGRWRHRFDAKGALISADDDRGNVIRTVRHPDGSLARLEIATSTGREMLVELDADARGVRLTDGDGNVRVEIRDELGRLVQVHDGESVLVDRDLGRLTDGRWLETTRTPETEIKLAFRDDALDEALVASRRGGEQLRLLARRDGRGSIEAVALEGLVDLEIALNAEGRLAALRLGDQTYTYRYDPTGRLVAASGGDQTLELAYADGALSRIRRSYDGADHAIAFDRDGRATAMSLPTGGAMALGHDDYGRLSRVERGEAASWTIKRRDAASVYERDGVPYLVMRFDDQGRITEVFRP